MPQMAVSQSLNQKNNSKELPNNSQTNLFRKNYQENAKPMPLKYESDRAKCRFSERVRVDAF